MFCSNQTLNPAVRAIQQKFDSKLGQGLIFYYESRFFLENTHERRRWILKRGLVREKISQKSFLKYFIISPSCVEHKPIMLTNLLFTCKVRI